MNINIGKIISELSVISEDLSRYVKYQKNPDAVINKIVELVGGDEIEDIKLGLTGNLTRHRSIERGRLYILEQINKRIALIKKYYSQSKDETIVHVADLKNLHDGLKVSLDIETLSYDLSRSNRDKLAKSVMVKKIEECLNKPDNMSHIAPNEYLLATIIRILKKLPTIDYNKSANYLTAYNDLSTYAKLANNLVADKKYTSERPTATYEYRLNNDMEIEVVNEITTEHIKTIETIIKLITEVSFDNIVTQYQNIVNSLSSDDTRLLLYIESFTKAIEERINNTETCYDAVWVDENRLDVIITQLLYLSNLEVKVVNDIGVIITEINLVHSIYDIIVEIVKTGSIGK